MSFLWRVLLLLLMNAVFLFLYESPSFYRDEYAREELKKECSLVQGVVYDVHTGKGNHYINYSFSIKGKEYKGVSRYGANKKVPFSVEDKVDYPVSLYAATKKSNELMAHCYSKLYGIPATGLRFFTVYGPFGRPDMAYFKFAKKIMNGETIQIYNNGDMMRDFTYIDDIVKGIANILPNPPAEIETGARYKVYNIGNNKPEKLMDYIETLEKHLGREAKKEFLPMQPGDVYQTYADVSDLMHDFDFKPSTSIDEGLGKFVTWFKEYYRYE